jgi:TolA-binding protein
MTVLLILALGAVCPTESRAQRTTQTSESEYAAAFKLYSDGLFDPSVEAFRTFRGKHPRHVSAPEALYYEGAALLALGRDAEAGERFRRFNDRYPDHPLALESSLALGKYYFDRGEHQQAITNLEEVLREGPPYEVAAKALYWMGEASAREGDLDAAVEYFARCAQAYRTSSTAPTAQYAVAYTEVKRGNFDAARNAFEILAERYPNSPYARTIGLALAEIYYDLGQYADAVAEIEDRLPSLRGDVRDRAEFLLAESYNHLRQSQDAIVRYRRFTDDPDGPYFEASVFGLGWNYQQEGAHQWASEEFSRLRDSPNPQIASKSAYYEAVNYKLAGDALRALEVYAEVVQRWPDGKYADEAQFERAVTLYELRRWSEAREAFRILVDRYPESPVIGEALGMLGSTHVALGDFDSALTTFSRAIRHETAPPAIRGEIEFQKAWLLYRERLFADAAPAFLDLFERYPNHAKTSEALFWAAESFYQTGQYGRATTLFLDYLARYPSGRNREAAFYAMGWTYFRQSDYATAAEYFERFLNSYPDESGFVPYRHDAQLRLADSYYALRRYPDAIRIYGSLAEDGDDYALYQIGQAFSNSDQSFDALTTFRRLLAEYPESEWREEATFSLGYTYFRSQDFDQAREVYRDLIFSFPRSQLTAKAQYGIGDAYFNEGLYSEAVREYRRVLDRYPTTPFAADAAGSLQYAYIALNDEDGVDVLIDSLVTADGDSPVVDLLRFKRAEVLYQSGRQDEALSNFQDFVRVASSQELLPEAYFYIGSIYVAQGDYAAADSYLGQLISEYGDSARRPEAAVQLGEVYLAQERYDSALETFESAEGLQLGVDLAARVRYGRIMALLNLDRFDEAEQLALASIEDLGETRESAPILLGLARVQESRSAMADASRSYRRVASLSQDETGAEALVRLGELLLRLGDAQTAIEELGRLPVLFSGYSEWVARSYLAQARAFRRLGNTGEAARMYDALLQDYPDTPFAETAQNERSGL